MTSPSKDALVEQATSLANAAQDLAQQAGGLALQASTLDTAAGHPSSDFFMMGLTILILAGFVGYYVVWRVTPALHAPLMAMTNAISSVIIVGGLLAAGLSGMGMSTVFGFFAVLLASINIFGGFMVTHRMLSMFKGKGK